MIVASLALAACSGGGGAPARSATSPTSSSSSSTSAAPSPASGSASSASLKGVKGAATSLSNFTCKATDKSWNASGKLVNTGKSKLTYQVRVAVVKPKSFEVLGTKQSLFDLDAGKSVDVRFDKIYTGPGDGLLCVPSVVTGTK